MFLFPSVMTTLCTGFFSLLAIIIGLLMIIDFIIEDLNLQTFFHTLYFFEAGFCALDFYFSNYRISTTICLKNPVICCIVISVLICCGCYGHVAFVLYHCFVLLIWCETSIFHRVLPNYFDILEGV